MRKCLQRKVREIREELYRRRHEPTLVMGQWLRTILVRRYGYYGVPHNSRRLSAFRYYLARAWQRALRRRSQKDRTIWEHMDRLARRWLPVPRILQPYPAHRLSV